MLLAALHARLSALPLTARGVGFAMNDDRVDVLVDGRPAGLAFALLPLRVDALEPLQLEGRLLSVTVPTATLTAPTPDDAPAVLLVWSAAQGHGVWALRDPMVSALDAHAPAWRGATAVQARLSAFDGTRDEGLERLLLAVGRGAVEARLSEASADAAAAVRAFIDEGAPFELGRGAHDALGLPVWFTRAYGDVDEAQGAVRYRSPTDRRLRARVEVRGPREVQTVAGIELGSTARGLSRATLSHASADSPFELTLEVDFDARAMRPTVTPRPGRLRAADALTALRLSRALDGGGRFTVIPLDPAEGSLSICVELGSVDPPRVSAELLALARDLAAVEAATGVALAWDASEPLSEEDDDALRMVLQAVTSGRVERRQERIGLELTAAMVAALCEGARGQQRVRVTLPASPYVLPLLGSAVPLGPRTREITGTLVEPLGELRRRVSELSPEAVVTLELLEVDRRDFYAEWPRFAR